jgi:hypothetical protein
MRLLYRVELTGFHSPSFDNFSHVATGVLITLHLSILNFANISLGYLFCGMATVKYEVEKFDGHNSFSLWLIKKILDGEVPSTSSMEERKELEEKAHNAILLSLSDGVLREVVDEKTVVGL